MSEQKLCKDCKWQRQSKFWDRFYCMKNTRDSGKVVYTTTARHQSGQCGPKAKHFSPLKPWWKVW